MHQDRSFSHQELANYLTTMDSIGKRVVATLAAMLALTALATVVSNSRYLNLLVFITTQYNTIPRGVSPTSRGGGLVRNQLRGFHIRGLY